MRREIHNLSMLTFPSSPNHVGHPLQGLGVLRRSTFFFGEKNSTFPYGRRNSTHWLFSDPPNPPRTLPIMTSFTSPGHISISDFYFDISEWHILPAHAWTPGLMLHRTNPCSKRKVLSLTKPKGKIYKTKSLGHYIT